MALVAYSDDSDLGSDLEDAEENVNGVGNNINAKKPAEMIKDEVNSSASPETSEQKPELSSGIDDIVDEDDNDYVRQQPTTNIPVSSTNSLLSRSSILASIPAAIPVDRTQSDVGISEAEDELTDVPTVDTWKVTKEIKSDNVKQKPTEKPVFFKKKQKSKVKFFVPALSEFDDDDEEEEEKEEPEKKKVKPSSMGTGLFSVLPEPKNIAVKEAKRALIPHILTKPPTARKPSKPKPPPRERVEVAADSDEDDAGPSDFFSLSESASDLASVAAVPLPAEKISVPNKEITFARPHKVEAVAGDVRQIYEVQTPDESVMNPQSQEMPQSYQPQIQSSSDHGPPGIDQEAMIRLMGKRRGKGEEINFIDVSADDALLTRDEWMTKALTEEKPTHSFSKKREGLPSQKQKQKHQITYLAHQAKERELELKNNWAQNRVTKMQTQAKYGF